MKPILFGVLGAWLLAVAPAQAYVEAAHSFGQVVQLSTNIMIVRVEKVDKEKNLIVYRKVRDLKGTHPTDLVKHMIGRGGFHPREWQYPMEWAEPGKTAIFFHNGGASETCIGTYWYQCYAGGEWWNMSHGEPFLLRTFAGHVDKLAAAVTEVQANREAIVPCMVDGNKEDLHLRRARIQRLRVGLKLQNYDSKRDFVGWGGEDFRRLQGMPAFTHYSALARVDPEAQAITCADVDGDGKPDLCLVGAGRLVVLLNGGESLNEISLPGFTGGCRAAVWADHNGDGKPDLLLATSSGPKLYTNLGGSFRDDTALLPRETAYDLTAAVWIDYDGDGKPDILLGNGFHGLLLYRNLGAAKAGRSFEDVSAAVHLGPEGLGSNVRGDTLTVCNVNGDGRQDILYGAGTGLLLRNTPQGFVEAKDCGISYRPGKVGPVFGDFDNDGHSDLFVPQSGNCKLYRNDGKGHFQDVTAQAGDLAKLTGQVTSAAWGDFDNDGHLDLLVGCLRGPNRYFRGKGDGTFTEMTENLGLQQRIFNSQAVALVDLNNDGMLDAVFNNEGQESCVLLGNREWAAKRSPVTLRLAGNDGVVGSQVRVRDQAGKLLASRTISGGDGRGGQVAPLVHFALEPGTYRVEVRFSSGVRRGREISVASSSLRGLIDDQTPKVVP